MAKTLHSVYCELHLRSRAGALLATAAILWIAALAYFSLLHLVPHAPTGTMVHRIEHMAVYGALALLLLPFCHTRPREWLIVLAVLCLAAGIEDGQHLIFKGVRFEWWDLRDDAIGIVFAWLVIRSFRRKLI